MSPAVGLSITEVFERNFFFFSNRKAGIENLYRKKASCLLPTTRRAAESPMTECRNIFVGGLVGIIWGRSNTQLSHCPLLSYRAGPALNLSQRPRLHVPALIHWLVVSIYFSSYFHSCAKPSEMPISSYKTLSLSLYLRGSHTSRCRKQKRLQSQPESVPALPHSPWPLLTHYGNPDVWTGLNWVWLNGFETNPSVYLNTKLIGEQVESVGPRKPHLTFPQNHTTVSRWWCFKWLQDPIDSLIERVLSQTSSSLKMLQA